MSNTKGYFVDAILPTKFLINALFDSRKRNRAPVSVGKTIHSLNYCYVSLTKPLKKSLVWDK